MGTYTTNYNLFMPTVGETGWGTLVNTNFSTIDTTMKGLSNRITTIENEVNGNLSCTSVTTSGKVTANGGIVGTTGKFSGAVTGTSFNSIPIKTSGTITVIPTSTYYNIPSSTDYNTSPIILPFLSGSATYTGSLKVKMAYGSSGNALSYSTDKAHSGYISIDVGETYTISFTAVKWLRVSYSRSGLIDYCTISGFTLS